MTPFVFRLIVLGVLGFGLAGCDKCTDYFWLDTATPHSCKDVAAPK